MRKQTIFVAPIVLFVYNRPYHTLQTLQNLSRNHLSNQSTLYIFSDASKNTTDQAKVKSVRQIIRQKKWCKAVNIIERESNMGLAKNIVDGVSRIIAEFGKVIVLEDDIVTSPGFLTYMNQALQLYENTPEVMHVSGYLPPIDTQEIENDTFFYNQTSCWGWGTWANAWNDLSLNTQELLDQINHSGRTSEYHIEGSFDFSQHLIANISGQLNTWAIKWHTSVFLKKGLCLHPKVSLTRNIGFDNTGEHCVYSEEYLKQKIIDRVLVESIPLTENKFIRQKIALFNNLEKTPFSQRKSFKNRIVQYLKWKK